MSLIQNIDHLFATRGIDAVVVQSAGQQVHRGDQGWTNMLAKALELRAMANQDAVRITLDAHSLVVQREGTQVAAVVIRSGDPVAKSLKRMIRRMAARVRPPVSVTSDADTNGGQGDANKVTSTPDRASDAAARDTDDSTRRPAQHVSAGLSAPSDDAARWRMS